MPSALEQVHQEFNQQGLTVLAIDVQENRDRVADWVKEKNVTSLALILSMIGFAILKAMDLKDTTDWVFAGFWTGGVVGGLLFGLGMVLAGGCGAGSIWRAGEGHVKLWVAVAFFAVGGSLSRLLLVQTQLLQKLGTAVFLPNLVGWQGAVSLVMVLMVSWYVFATRNERSRKFSLI